jgi:hypothetical protein
MAADALASGVPGHLTLCDGEGFPLPLRVRAIERDAAGFRMDVPKGAPWPVRGKASLSFVGAQIFLGAVRSEGGTATLAVDRAVPTHPFVADQDRMWDPRPDIHAALMERLQHEAARRGQDIPTLPEHEPEPSAGARIRLARFWGGCALIVKGTA